MPTTFKIAIYTPNLLELPDETASVRAARMVTAIEGVADADIFLGPEYFFAHNTSTLISADSSAKIAYTDAEADLARNKISVASARFRDMLIVPGTFFMIQGVSSPRIFNTAFVYRAGSKIAECSKFDAAADDAYARRSGYEFYPGERGVAFTFKGKSFYLQICADATTAPAAAYDMSLVTSFMPGGAILGGLDKCAGRRAISNGEGINTLYTGQMVPGRRLMVREVLSERSAQAKYTLVLP